MGVAHTHEGLCPSTPQGDYIPLTPLLKNAFAFFVQSFDETFSKVSRGLG